MSVSGCPASTWPAGWCEAVIGLFFSAPPSFEHFFSLYIVSEGGIRAIFCLERCWGDKAVGHLSVAVRGGGGQSFKQLKQTKEKKREVSSKATEGYPCPSFLPGCASDSAGGVAMKEGSKVFMCPE